MKKFRKYLSFLLALCLITAALPYAVYAEGEYPDISFDYSKIGQGQVDRKTYSICEKVQDAEKGEVYKVVPNTASAESGKVTVDAWSLDKFKVNLSIYNTMKIEYKYTSSTADEYIPVLGIGTYGGKTVKKYRTANAKEPLSKGGWQTMEFDLSAITKDNIGTDGILWQMHLSPFGTKKACTDMTSGETILLGRVTLSVSKTAENEAELMSSVNVTFTYDKEGLSDPAAVSGASGSKITLPASVEHEGEVLSRWFCETDSKYYDAGSEFTLPNKNVKFIASWIDPAEIKNYAIASYADYTGGICNRVDTATYEILENYEGFEAVKITPNLASANNGAINMDGWTYGGAKLDVSKYSTMLMVYKYVSDKPVSGKSRINILKGQNFTGSTGMDSRENIVQGEWAAASYNMTGAVSKIDPGKIPYITQMHIYPLGTDSKPSQMSAEDEIYIADIIAIPEATKSAAYRASYIGGYDDGTFRPAGNMTRAESCAVIARLMAGGDAYVPSETATSFSDVAAAEWFAKYVAYCEKAGLLTSYSGTFSPNQNITRAEFVELVFKMGLIQNSGGNGTFTDVASDHPRADVISAAGKAGLVNGYANGDGTFSFRPDSTITRTEVVKVINNALGRASTVEAVEKSGCTNAFSDIDASFWGYAEILDAANTHISCITNDGKEIWVPMTATGNADAGFKPDYEAAAAKAAQVEALMEKRIEEIVNAKDELTVTGKKIYVSNKGNDANDGLSEKTPKATIQAAQGIAVSGDAVLLERGSQWRINFTTVAGVSYGAYGEGAKPVINGNTTGNAADPSLWTLVPGTTNIYTYRDKLLDVGNIIYDDGSKYTDKIVPSINDSLELCTNVNSKKYDPLTSHTENNTYFMVYDNITSKTLSMPKTYGTLYLRCDEGNPGSVYKNIEIASYGHAIIAKSNNTFDNLCIKFAGGHGITAGTCENLVIRNCEIGYIGGTSQYINNGKNTRYGNGIQIYGGCDGYTIENCYVYECYDAGISPQYSAVGTNDIIEKNIYFRNNVIDKCIYNIEYFMGKSEDGSAERYMENVYFENNILARSGYGWGMSPTRSACIKGWDHYNRASNFVISGNIIYNPAYNAYHIGADFEGWLPEFSGNTYIIRHGAQFVKYGANGTVQYTFDSTAGKTAEKALGEKSFQLYYLSPDFSES